MAAVGSKLAHKRPRIPSTAPQLARWLQTPAAPPAVSPPYQILFFGADSFSCEVFRKVHEAREDLGHDMTVVTPPDQRIGRRGRDLHRPRLRLLAEELGVSTLALPEKTLLKGWKPPDAFLTPSSRSVLLTASFGHLIPNSLLAHFAPLNALNVHPSLLPRWRGAAPIQWSILAGDQIGGVTVQELSRGRFDRGRILAQEESRLAPDADFASLELELARAGGNLLVATLRDFPQRQSLARPQSDEGATHARKLVREDARVRWADLGADEVCRLQRALGHQHPLWTTLSGVSHQLDIDPVPVDSSIAPGSLAFESSSLQVGCRTGSVRVRRVKREGGKGWIDAKEWWAGNRSRVQSGFV
ncbi:hypothetical protein JCM10908_000465 [Rhodotorula pacifica]|uniref:methionyl-tRNA formyltransferase n=1 Tax=Rhodotorula pacifica TaxID=1495444 RepID=UPI0031706A7E